MSRDKREAACEYYKPDQIDWLLVAEAPPISGKFFYFDDPKWFGGLSNEVASVVYPDIKFSEKLEFLNKFKGDGFYLVDISKEPITDRASQNRVKKTTKEVPP